MDLIRQKLFTPVEIYSLVFIRIAFGLIMFCDIAKYFYLNLIDYYFIEPEFHFKYFGFEWVQVLPSELLYLLFVTLAVLALMIALGLFYRVSSILFLIGFTYIFLLEKAIYLNHYYMVIIFNFLLCFMPANHYFSVDADYLFPKIKTNKIPAWSVILLRIQMEIILIYAGIVKINPDWLQFYPLKFWFANQGPFFSNIYIIAIASYGSILLHIIGAPLLLFKKTRLWIFLIYVIFHCSNAYIFNIDIGIFPWITLAFTTIFFDPDWPKNFLRFNESVGAYRIRPLNQNLILTLIIIWCAFQILFPLRKYLYPGNPVWHQQGYYFSWQMKLSHFEGSMTFHIKDNKTGEYLTDYKIQNTPYGELRYLTSAQLRSMGCKSDMILQYANFLKEKWTKKIGHDDISVFASVVCSLNGRKMQFQIDQFTDLAKEKEDFSFPKWIIPLDRNSKAGEIYD